MSSKPNALESFLDISATVDTSFPADCSDSGFNSLFGEIFETGPLSLDVVVMIVCQHLLRCLLLYFLRGWCHLYIHSDLQ
jgi:hypothetical protein